LGESTSEDGDRDHDDDRCDEVRDDQSQLGCHDVSFEVVVFSKLENVRAGLGPVRETGEGGCGEPNPDRRRGLG
jgi:hypothetical protein